MRYEVQESETRGAFLVTAAESLVAQIEFNEWTSDGHLRHASFAGLREEKSAPRREIYSTLFSGPKLKNAQENTPPGKTAI
jgi:ATP-dependent DNA ligase